jgi:hypothetical protein
MKSFLILFFICWSSLSIAQDTNSFNINSFHFEYTFLGRVIRSSTLPDDVRKGGFYQHFFGNHGVPERIINRSYNSKQFGVNLGFRFDSYSKKNNHELLLGIGYQNSGGYIDILRRHDISSQDSLGSRNNLAKIEIEQQYREIYFNGAWLFKTEGIFFSVHTGVGFNLAFSNPEYWITEYEKGIKRTSYKVRNGTKTYRSFYIPFGFELKGSNGSGGGFVLGMDYSLRLDNHLYSGFSISIGYKL